MRSTLLLLVPFLAAGASVESRPNVVLLMADDQGWGDVGYYGHPVLKTPELDAMAAAGLRFDRFYAAAPVCSPTRGSVLTGRHPNRFGCFKWGHSLRPQEVTLAETMKAAGYATGHFGKWHLGSVRAGSPVNPGASGFDRWLSAENFYDNDPILSREGTAVRLKGESSMIAADAAVEFMRDQVKAAKPFLAVVWFGSPHVPHQASDETRAPYAGTPKADYYGEIAGIDRAVGKVRSELAALGIRKDTMVWYCSDNGGVKGTGVTGGRAGKAAIYEGGLRVPGILEWPARIPKPRTTTAVAVTSDLLPTILELTGVPLPAGNPPLDGVSLAPIIDGKRETRPRPVGFWDHPTPGVGTPSDKLLADQLEAQKRGEPGDRKLLRLDAGEIKGRHPEDSFPGHAAWLDWPWKLHRIQPKEGPARGELYRLSDDPEEAKDLLAAEPDRARTMTSELEAWLLSVVRSLNGADYR